MVSMIQEAWYSWSGLFRGLPYGDPYVAGAALFVLMVVAAKLTVGRETSRY